MNELLLIKLFNYDRNYILYIHHIFSKYDIVAIYVIIMNYFYFYFSFTPETIQNFVTFSLLYISYITAI